MALHYRRMKLKDVDTCVEFIACHPVIGPRYEKNIFHLSSAVKTVLHLESVRAFLFEESSETGSARPFATAIVGFVSDEFVRRATKPPYFWIGPEITRLTLGGQSPFLSDEQLRAGNTSLGLNATTWLWGIGIRDVMRMEVHKHAMEAFHTELHGFRLKVLMGQSTGKEELKSILRDGGLLLSPTGKILDLPDKPLEEIVQSPHIFVMNRELLANQLGTWTSMLFVHQEPRIGFSQGEQRLLEEALRGGTDEELAMELEISTSAVKKAWRSIYNRVERSKIGILPSGSNEIETPDRGKGKKHRLLAYVREHPEELRPISMKLLNQAQKDAKPGQLKVEPTPTRRRVGRPRLSRP